jgi:hypothetical protein
VREAYKRANLASPDLNSFRFLRCDDCEHFKDHSRFVELPCKVGDTVYLLHNVYNNILAYSVSKILINSGEPIIEIVEDERRIHILHIPARKLNNSLFLTKEQAEQALKEREENEH